MSSMNHDDWNRDTMERGRPQRQTAPSRQIEPGFFVVRSQTGRTGGETVDAGRLFVEGTPGGKVLIEHWVLSEKHVSPNGLQGMLVEKEESGESFDSLLQFFDAMRTRSSDWSKVVYIKATCEYFDEIPV